MTKRFDYEIGDFVADKFGNVYKVLDIDDYERIPVKVKIVERKTETYFCGFEPASSRDEAWLFDKNFALDVVDDGKITFANDLRQISNYKKEIKMKKAEKIEQVYDVAQWQHNTHSEGCYSLAVAAAHELGGIEVDNSNNGEGSKSYAPSITFEFDDGSSAYVMCGGVYVIE